MTCKDCIHNEMCYGTHTDESPTCCDFLDRSEWVHLPCKVGDKVYQTDGIRIYQSTIRKIVYDTENIAFDDTAIGKTIFFTCEEAEKAKAEKGVTENEQIH